MSIHLILKNINGEFLTQVADVAGLIIVGSAPHCDIQIPDPQVKDEQIRFSCLNGELWIQVPDPSEEVRIDDKPLREIKVSASTVVFFKDYFIEVLFKLEETVSNNESTPSPYTHSSYNSMRVDVPAQEATRVVSDMTEATRVVSAVGVQKEVSHDEATRIEKMTEATRVVTESEATRVVSTETPQNIANNTLQKMKERQKINQMNHETRDHSFLVDDFWTFLGDIRNSIPNDKLKDISIGLGGIFLICAILLMIPKKESGDENISRTDIGLETLAAGTVQNTNKNPAGVKIQAVSKEQFLRSFEGLFTH